MLVIILNFSLTQITHLENSQTKDAKIVARVAGPENPLYTLVVYFKRYINFGQIHINKVIMNTYFKMNSDMLPKHYEIYLHT